MENVKKCPPRLPLTKCMVASFAVGLLLCATNASAADELARSVYSTNLTQQNNRSLVAWSIPTVNPLSALAS